MKAPLFQLFNIKDQDSLLTGTAHINVNDPIFNGHFPNNPVLPGACQLNLISEIIKIHFAKVYRMTQAKSLKFTMLVNPFIINQFDFEIKYLIEGNSLLLNGKFVKEDKTIFKFIINYTS